jgi:hypothetical protein
MGIDAFEEKPLGEYLFMYLLSAPRGHSCNRRKSRHAAVYLEDELANSVSAYPVIHFSPSTILERRSYIV